MRPSVRRAPIGLSILAVVLAGVLDARPATAPAARSILFVGNSFTFGAGSPVQRFHPERVTDLNKEGIGGVPALFKTFATEAKLEFDVSLETSPGKPLSWHLTERRPLLEGKWDVVVLQGYSTLDPQNPGNPAAHVKGAQDLARLFKAANPNAEIDLVTTWSRADQVYKPEGAWYGKPIYQMADDLAAASVLALQGSRDLNASIPVGGAWNRAMRDGVADPNPFDGVEFGKVNLWTWDQYHASTEGYYLEALVIFGKITGVDPTTLGARESAASDLGMSMATVRALQKVAHDELEAGKQKRP